MTDADKVAEFISFLTDKALQWGTVVWNVQDEALMSFDRFLQLFHHVFEHCLDSKDAGEELHTITKGGCRAAEYALEFLTIAAGSRWNEKALKATFRKGLR